MRCERCRGDKNVTFDVDPYQNDIYGDSSKHWLCAKCRKDIADSI